MNRILIQLKNNIAFDFYGEYLPERQTNNWHYYKMVEDKNRKKLDEEKILHIKKDQMICVIEGENEKNY